MNSFKKTLSKIILFALIILIGQTTYAKPPKREFYEIKIYTLKNKEQENRVDQFLKDAYIPAMHRMGITKVGVFKPVAADTGSFGKLIYVITPLKSQNHILNIANKLDADMAFQNAGSDYLNAKFNLAPYARFETIILQAFSDAPNMILPNLSGPKSERIYELRSYEGHTEKIYQNKVKMFNAGGEVKLFKKLNFNAVFYGEVITGSHMPNLMYMTTFENKADRDEHWKAFSSAPEWTALKTDAQYQNNVSKNTQYFLFPTDYSDF
jgi:NIPSNAP